MMKALLKPFGAITAIAALGMGSVAHAQLTDPLTAAITLEDVFGIGFGAENGSDDCPGGTDPNADEEIFDFSGLGLPDYAQVALVYELIQINNPTVIAAVNDARDNYDSLLAFAGLLGASPEDMAKGLDILAMWTVVNLSVNMPNANCAMSGDAHNLFMAEFAKISPSSDLDGLVGANADLNGDGTTNKEHWDAVVGNKNFVGDDAAFLAAVDSFVAAATDGMIPDPDATPFPPAPQGTPVAGPLGIALLAAGAAGLGLYRMRRKQ